MNTMQAPYIIIFNNYLNSAASADKPRKTAELNKFTTPISANACATIVWDKKPAEGIHQAKCGTLRRVHANVGRPRNVRVMPGGTQKHAREYRPGSGFSDEISVHVENSNCRCHELQHLWAVLLIVWVFFNCHGRYKFRESAPLTIEKSIWWLMYVYINIISLSESGSANLAHWESATIHWEPAIRITLTFSAVYWSLDLSEYIRWFLARFAVSDLESKVQKMIICCFCSIYCIDYEYVNILEIAIKRLGRV